MNLRPIFAIFLTGLCLQASAQTPEQLYRQQPSVSPELAAAGEYTVGVRTQSVKTLALGDDIDPSSTVDRPLTLEIWYPAVPPQPEAAPAQYRDQTRSGKEFILLGQATRQALPLSSGAWPLVVLSHGYTGYRNQLFYKAEHLASHGYVVISIDHTDSTNADIDFENNPVGGFLSTLENRALDQQAVLEAAASGEFPWLETIDQTRSAVIGFSMGGYGLLNTIGGCYAFSDAFFANSGLTGPEISETRARLSTCNARREHPDPRWKAAVAIAPWGGEQNIHEPSSLNQVETPVLYIAGEEDDVVGYENGVKKLFSQTGNADMLLFENARHNLGIHPAPKISYGNEFDLGHYHEPAWDTETINRITNHFVLAFLDCHVKHNAERCAYLPERESATQVKQADGKLTPSWPGFNDRWGVGLRYYKNRLVELKKSTK